jgi:hypothetical protein
MSPPAIVRYGDPLPTRADKAEYANLISLFGIAHIQSTAFAPTIFFITAQLLVGRRWWQSCRCFCSYPLWAE